MSFAVSVFSHVLFKKKNRSPLTFRHFWDLLGNDDADEEGSCADGVCRSLSERKNSRRGKNRVIQALAFLESFTVLVNELRYLHVSIIRRRKTEKAPL